MQVDLLDGGVTGVLTTTSFVVRFNRFLLPGNAIRQALCVRADLAEITSYAECGGLFLEPTYDPIRREIIYRQNASQPHLAPGTKYKLTVLAPLEGSPGGIQAFDGAPLLATRSLEFTTAAMDPAAATLETLPTGDLYCTSKKECLAECAATTLKVSTCETAGGCQSCSAVCNCPASDPLCSNNCAKGDTACATACKDCNDCQTTCRPLCVPRCSDSIQDALRNCAFANCHHEDRDMVGTLKSGAAMGLDLYDPAFLSTTAINKVAHQTQQGEHGDSPDKAPLRFGRSMPIIDAGTPGLEGGAPGNSYLLYKLAVGASATGEAAVDPLEIARLRASVVVGLAMPPSQGSALQEADLRSLVTWIAQGAPTPICQ